MTQRLSSCDSYFDAYLGCEMSDDMMKVLCNPTVDVATAGRVLGIGRDAAKKAAKAGHIPTIRLNERDRVPTAKLRVMLGLPDQPPGAQRAA